MPDVMGQHDLRGEFPGQSAAFFRFSDRPPDDGGLLRDNGISEGFKAICTVCNRFYVLNSPSSRVRTKPEPTRRFVSKGSPYFRNR